MEVRILGTNFFTEIERFTLISKDVDWLLCINREPKHLIIEQKDENSIQLSFTSHVTMKQNVEAWEAVGLVKEVNGKIKILTSSRSLIEIMPLIKKNLLESSTKRSIEQLKNMRLLCIAYLNGEVTPQKLKEWNIIQARGDLNTNKIHKETAKFEKILFSDKNWVNQALEVFHEKITHSQLF